jgi:hypothetical protein
LLAQEMTPPTPRLTRAGNQPCMEERASVRHCSRMPLTLTRVCTRSSAPLLARLPPSARAAPVPPSRPSPAAYAVRNRVVRSSRS